MSIDYNFFKVDGTFAKPAKGRILVSEPFLSDNYFKRSIVFLTEYSKDNGSIGFVLNKPVNVNLSDIIDNLPDVHVNISIGGPVKTDTLHYIHTMGDKIPNSIPVVDNIYWGGDFEIVQDFLKGGLLDFSQIRFFLGYSGWSPKQLESELARDSWLVTDIPPGKLMALNHNDIWSEILQNVSEEKYQLWPRFPENPLMN